jgi:benzoate/toluate 1,2-dioxygenase subunit alpha
MDLRAEDYAIYLGRGHGVDLMLREHELYGEDVDWTENSKRESFVQKLSEVQLKWAKRISFHLLIFPNVVIFDTASPAPQIRVVRPLSVDRTEVLGYCYLPVAAKPEARSRMLKAYEDFFGPASMGTPDDIEVLKSCTEGYGATAAPYNDLSRGIHRERKDLDIKEFADFEVAGNGTDDTVYRGIYRWWANIMRTQEA